MGRHHFSCGTCPSCERWTGLRLECPYCGCDAVGRNHLAALRAAALALALSGLLGLMGLRTGRAETPSACGQGDALRSPPAASGSAR